MDVREKLVELIEQSGACFNCFPVAGYEKDEIEKIASNLIAHGVTVQEWISVKDRLPEENAEVLIYCKTNSGKEVFFVDKIRYFRGIPIWQVWSGKVTHWMSLPQPPKGD